MRDRGYAGLGDNSPPDSPRQALASISCPPLPSPPPGKPIPPPIDPGVFRSVATIRRLIDEASELAVRASSGMSAAALGSMRNGASPNLHSSPWALAQSLGMNPLGETGGGRNVAMSAMRIHRLRALAVQKLAAAYRADEIASSVMVMQGGSVFEDIAERVLKVGASADPFQGVFRRHSIQTRMTPMPNTSTFSMKRYPLGSWLSSSPSTWRMFTGRVQTTRGMYNNSRSRRAHRGLPPTSRTLSHAGHRPYIPGRVWRRCQRFYPCAKRSTGATQSQVLPSQRQSLHIK